MNPEYISFKNSNFSYSLSKASLEAVSDNYEHLICSKLLDSSPGKRVKKTSGPGRELYSVGFFVNAQMGCVPSLLLFVYLQRLLLTQKIFSLIFVTILLFRFRLGLYCI